MAGHSAILHVVEEDTEYLPLPSLHDIYSSAPSHRKPEAILQAEVKALIPSPVIQLPFEILTQIFVYTLQTSRPLFTVVSLSQVSMQWRNIMLDNPKYWTDVVLDFDLYTGGRVKPGNIERGWSTAFWEEILMRSNDLPLLVTVTGSLVDEHPSAQDLETSNWKIKSFPANSGPSLEAVAIRSSRWFHVFLHVADPDYIYDRLDMMGVNFTNMHSLDMSRPEHSSSYTGLCPPFLSRCLSLEVAVLPSDISPVAASGRTLRMQAPALRKLEFQKQEASYISTLIHAYPNLTSLEIHEIILPSLGDPLWQPPLRFRATESFLQSLTLNFIPRAAEFTMARGLANLSLPHLEELHLHCEEAESSYPSTGNPFLGGPLANLMAGHELVRTLPLFLMLQNEAAKKFNAPGLKILEIQNLIRASGRGSLQRVLNALPHGLQSLDIGEFIQSSLPSEFNEENLAILSGQGGRILPDLKRLWLSITGAMDPELDHVIVNMIQERCRAGCSVEMEFNRYDWLPERQALLDAEAERISAEGRGEVVFLW